MIKVSRLRELKEKLQQRLKGMHIVDKHVYIKFSIFNYFHSGDFTWDYNWVEPELAVLFQTKHEHVAKILDALYPDIKVELI